MYAYFTYICSASIPILAVYMIWLGWTWGVDRSAGSAASRRLFHALDIGPKSRRGPPSGASDGPEDLAALGVGSSVSPLDGSKPGYVSSIL